MSAILGRAASTHPAACFAEPWCGTFTTSTRGTAPLASTCSCAAVSRSPPSSTDTACHRIPRPRRPSRRSRCSGRIPRRAGSGWARAPAGARRRPSTGRPARPPARRSRRPRASAARGAPPSAARRAARRRPPRRCGRAARRARPRRGRRGSARAPAAGRGVTPSRRRQRSTAVGSGPASTTTASPGPASRTVASPWPTSHIATRQPGGGHAAPSGTPAVGPSVSRPATAVSARQARASGPPRARATSTAAPPRARTASGEETAVPAVGPRQRRRERGRGAGDERDPADRPRRGQRDQGGERRRHDAHERRDDAERRGRDRPPARRAGWRRSPPTGMPPPIPTMSGATASCAAALTATRPSTARQARRGQRSSSCPRLQREASTSSPAVAAADIAKPTEIARNGSSSTSPPTDQPSASSGRMRASTSTARSTTAVMPAARTTDGCGRATTTYAATASATSTTCVRPRRTPTRRTAPERQQHDHRDVAAADRDEVGEARVAHRGVEVGAARRTCRRRRGPAAGPRWSGGRSRTASRSAARTAPAAPCSERRTRHDRERLGDERRRPPVQRVGGQQPAVDAHPRPGQQGRDVAGGEHPHRQVDARRTCAADAQGHERGVELPGVVGAPRARRTAEPRRRVGREHQLGVHERVREPTSGVSGPSTSGTTRHVTTPDARTSAAPPSATSARSRRGTRDATRTQSHGRRHHQPATTAHQRSAPSWTVATRATADATHRQPPTRTPTSHPHVRLEPLEGARADARHLAQLVDAGEPAVRGPPVEDAPGHHRSDSGQGVEVAHRRGVEVDDRRRGAAVGWSSRPAPRPRRATPRPARRRRALAPGSARRCCRRAAARPRPRSRRPPARPPAP